MYEDMVIDEENDTVYLSDHGLLQVRFKYEIIVESKKRVIECFNRDQELLVVFVKLAEKKCEKKKWI